MKLHLFLATALLTCLHAAGQEKTVESLVSELEKPDPKAREELVRKGESVVPGLVAILKDAKASQRARSTAALVLGKIGGEKVVEPLRLAINDKQIGFAAIAALGDVGPLAKPAVADLTKIAGNKADRRSPDGHLAQLATEAIAKIGHGSKEVIDVLVARMTEKRDEEAAAALTKLGEPGAEALLTLALKYSNDERPAQDKRYGEAYAVLTSGRPGLPKELIPVFEKHLKADDEKAELSALALGSMGLPAKPMLLKLLDHENQEVVLKSADGLSWMNFEAQSARRFRKEKVEDPVNVDEVFPRLLKILRSSKDLTLNLRITTIMMRLNKEKADALPEVRKTLGDALKEGIKRAVEDLEKEKAAKAKAAKKYTVWVFQKVNSRWVKHEDRTYVGDEETARKYLADVNKTSGWTATSNLPKTEEHNHDQKH